MNSLAVIIPTHTHEGRLDSLARLINALSETANDRYIEEILIIDNGCTLTGDIAAYKAFAKEKTRIISEPRVGLSYARNAGIFNSKSDIIAFLDDDVIASENWAESIIIGHNNHNVLCVGGPVLIDKSEIIKYPSWFSNYFLRFILPPAFPDHSCVIKPPHYLIGANFSFKRSTFESFGVFDHDLGRKGASLLSNEDIEFLTRIPQDTVWFESGAAVSEKILESRLRRAFMIRRLFWQGISDRIMTEKRGLGNFHDRKEVFMTSIFIKSLISRIIKARLFEAMCMLVRLFSYKYGYLIAKRRAEH